VGAALILLSPSVRYRDVEADTCPGLPLTNSLTQPRIITLYRNTLLLDWTEVKAEVDRFGSGEPWHLRIRNAPQICLEAAKETINLQVMATEAGEPSYVSIGTSPLAAAYVLAIYIRRQPASILSRTHSEVRLQTIGI
jgi:hypothetical protein